MQSDPDSYNGCMDDMPKLAQTIDQVVAGRTELYEAIVRYYEGFVFSVAVRVTFDRDLAYDVTQDTFLKLYGSLSKFRGSPGSRHTFIVLPPMPVSTLPANGPSIL